MYRTCLFCTRDMGSNDAIELLPIGRRIAFDAAQGRLWVICRGCDRWNLVPFDTRLETIDVCERLFHGSRTRYSTGNIGLAHLPDGLDLVRIGKAPQVEEIGWRYGDEFQRRRRRYQRVALAGGVAATGLLASAYAIGPAAGVAALLTGYFGATAMLVRGVFVPGKIVGRLPLQEKTGGVFTRGDVLSSLISLDRETGGWRIRTQARPKPKGKRLSVLDTSPRSFLAEGERAIEVVAHLVPPLNRAGAPASGHLMREAMRIMAQGNVVGRMVEMARRSPMQPLTPTPLYYNHSSAIRRDEYPLFGFPPSFLLALEMTLHADRERAALAGELAWLERQWREADQLAAIADALALPADAMSVEEPSR